MIKRISNRLNSKHVSEKRIDMDRERMRERLGVYERERERDYMSNREREIEKYWQGFKINKEISLQKKSEFKTMICKL